MRDFVFLALLFSLLVVAGVVFSDGGLVDIAEEATAPAAQDVTGESSARSDQENPEEQDQEFRGRTAQNSSDDLRYHRTENP